MSNRTEKANEPGQPTKTRKLRIPESLREIWTTCKRTYGRFATIIMFFAIVFPILHMSTWAITSCILGDQGGHAAEKLAKAAPNSEIANSIVGVLRGWKFGSIMLCFEAFCSMIGGTFVTIGWLKERAALGKRKKEKHVFFFVPELEVPESVTPRFAEAIRFASEDLFNGPADSSAPGEMTPQAEPSTAQDKPAFVMPKVSWRLLYSDVEVPGAIKPENINHGRVASGTLKELSEAAKRANTLTGQSTTLPGSMAGYILA
ncbi:hypothetical protein TWF694_009400 [Orbilia ellipsospora]|uniref:Uncharacterized protein n=1 Tax=Orbilia ellipsospora TaxID=2528407 RepID=A0AAV9XBX2_9PEZI